MSPPTHLLYLHGFRSSPLSFKAQRVAGWLQQHRRGMHWWCPQLPPSPGAAMQQVLQGVADWPKDRSAVMGSSLGGFYAGIVAERLGWPAVLLNPAVDPARDLAAHIGEQSTWQNPEDRFFFRAEFIAELQALQPPPRFGRPERVMAVIAKGDELLDWREMAARCEGAHIRLLEGSDHALSDFDAQLPAVLAFLELA
jgi:uncharacterized protein